MPQPPDPYALHNATLASLQQQAAATAPATSTSTRRTRTRAESRGEAAPAAPVPGTPIAVSPRGVGLGMSIVALIGILLKWGLILGWRLVRFGFNVVIWTMDAVTSGSHRYDQYGRRTD